MAQGPALADYSWRKGCSGTETKVSAVQSLNARGPKVVGYTR